MWQHYSQIAAIQQSARAGLLRGALAGYSPPPFPVVFNLVLSTYLFIGLAPCEIWLPGIRRNRQ